MNEETGYISLFIGPMFSRKTSNMCTAVERWHIANKKCIIIGHSSDVRYGKTEKIITHSGYTPENIPMIRAYELKSAFDELTRYDVIGVDEVQFFPDCVEIINKLANMGKIIICAGLDADYKGRCFGRVHELIPLAEEVTKLKAVCIKCYSDASFTARTSDETEIEVVGGADKYIAVCRKHMEFD